ncbi:MAG: hypothetical protein OQK56_05430 [Ignavibacteriaceae bacterium]|jgi:hypothetical protein|nr:hypothetical protein [Ignavibacteriaceae bacterium]
MIILIAVVAGIVKVFSKLWKDETIILEKGVPELQYNLFVLFVWLPVIAQIVASFILINPPVVRVLILSLLHVPTLWVGHLMARKLNTGFDYERKAGGNIELSLWITYGSIGIIYIGYLWAFLFKAGH